MSPLPKLLLLPLLLFGCVVNPRYSDPNTIYAEQAQKNPQNAERIKRDQEEYQREYAKQNSFSTQKNYYEVTDEKTSGWSVGDPNAVIHLGANYYKYHHKVSLIFVCNKSSFLPTPISGKNIKWRISDTIYGHGQTSRSGEVKINFASDEPRKYYVIHVLTDKNEYDIRLSGDLTIEGKPGDCG
jgi:hypothetical protein